MRNTIAHYGLAAIAIACLFSAPAGAATIWNWQYSGAGVTASGTLTTVDTPNASGGFLITSVTGVRNGEAINGLQATGTAIPGNEPFAVDNLIFPGPGAQLSGDGFGFSTAAGNFGNPFYADFLPTPGYLEFFSKQPGTPGASSTEIPVQFSATLAAVPEPATFLLVLGAFGIVTLKRSRLRNGG